ncbi:MAG TPA: class I SAM-dependent methyltransferase [Streptosporangiaceae bacterium]|nr:class I SAM-dependent methyltransferase [Streptosporangiaceae bacterium]
MGLAEPGQAGEATAAPESNVILLGQESGPGPSAATPERAAAAPAGLEQAEATAHAEEAARTGAAPTKNAAKAEAGASGAAVPETAATEAGAKGAAVSDTAATETGATDAGATEAGATEAAAMEAAAAPDRAPRPAPAETGLFARYTRDYVTGHDGHQITILQAGCTTADGDLGVSVLREAGADIAVSLIDDDQPVTRAALAADGSLAECVQGDLRTVPLPPRSHDIVLCSLLLQRIDHAELVLDRLVAAIRPGGLLLLRFSDRDSSGGFLDRVMPSAARTAVWRKRRPGRPGPYPAVYERLSSVRGVQAYALMRELVIAERHALGGLAGALAEPRGFLAVQKLAAWLSRGRLTAAHEELLYVLRKPEDRFARIL